MRNYNAAISFLKTWAKMKTMELFVFFTDLENCAHGPSVYTGQVRYGRIFGGT